MLQLPSLERAARKDPLEVLRQLFCDEWRKRMGIEPTPDTATGTGQRF